MLLDPAVQELYDGWEELLGSAVAALRAQAKPDVEDPELNELVGELSVRSEAFRRLWSRHDVRAQVGGGVHRLRHPQVGELELRYEKFAVAGADGQTLVIYHAEPGSRSQQALALPAGIAPAPSPTRPAPAARRGP